MTSNPLVTVVVPTHKRPDFLAKTVAAILGQTYQNIELIIVSNGVNPANEECAKSFQDPRIRYVDQKNSGGPSSPRNHGIQLANGEYIGFCDDDDIWMPQKLEKQVEALEKHPDCGMCYTRMISFNENGDEWTVEQESNPASFETMLYRNEVPVSSVLIRTALVRKYGGYHEGPEVGDSEDYEFSLRYAYLTKFVFIDEILLRYWAGKGRTTASSDVRTFKDELHYIGDILGCFGVFLRRFKVNPVVFAGPVFNACKNAIKVCLYQALKRNNLIHSNS